MESDGELDLMSNDRVEDHMAYEEIEIERSRLVDLASMMTGAELRRAGARIADYLNTYQDEIDDYTRAKLQFRGRMAIDLYGAVRDGTIRHRRAKRMMAYSLDTDVCERIIKHFHGPQTRSVVAVTEKVRLVGLLTLLGRTQNGRFLREL